MSRFVILCAILSVAAAQAETLPRCGTDAFGNSVCMDGNGVLSIVPSPAADSKVGTGAASAVAPDDASHDERVGRRRCSTDPFGNIVCSEQ